MGALRTLAEVRLTLVHRCVERLVVRGALDGAFDLIAAGAGLPQDAAEKAACGMQRAGCRACGRALEFGHETVAAAVAEELKLKAFVSGMISVIACELDECHARSI